MASTIQVRVDDELKTKSEELFRDLGTDTTTAIRMFLTQALAVKGSEKSRAHAAQGMYKDADEVIHDVRAKYGL